jgi:hypothetical protein
MLTLPLQGRARAGGGNARQRPMTAVAPMRGGGDRVTMDVGCRVLLCV